MSRIEEFVRKMAGHLPTVQQAGGGPLDAAALDAALHCFAGRQRRFGQTGDQVEQSRRA